MLNELSRLPSDPASHVYEKQLELVSMLTEATRIIAMPSSTKTKQAEGHTFTSELSLLLPLAGLLPSNTSL